MEDSIQQPIKIESTRTAHPTSTATESNLKATSGSEHSSGPTYESQTGEAFPVIMKDHDPRSF